MENNWKDCLDCGGIGLHGDVDSPELCFSCHGMGSVCSNCYEPYEEEHNCEDEIDKNEKS